MSEPGPSTSQVEASSEIDVEAATLLSQGRRHLLVEDVPAAIQCLQDACALLGTKYGELANECGECYYYYGCALLELARMESGVLGNALDGVPVEEAQGNVDNADKLEKNEKEKIFQDVQKALEADKEANTDEESGIATDEDARDANEDVATAKEDAIASAKEGVPASAKDDGAVSAKEGVAADAKEDAAADAKVDAAADAKVDAAASKDATDKDETTHKDAALKEKAPVKDATAVAKEDTKEEITSKGDAKDAATSGEIDNKDATPLTKDTLKSGNEDKVETDLSSVVEKQGAKDEVSESKMDVDDDKQDDDIDDGDDEDKADQEDGADVNGATDDGADGATGEDVDGATDEDTKDDDVPNFQLSWEMLELARVIFSKQSGKEFELKVAQVYLKLGELGLETGSYAQSIEDFTMCLTRQKEHLDSDSRLLAETHYNLALAYSFDQKFDKAIENFEQSMAIIHNRITKKQAIVKEEPTGKDIEEHLKEIKELEALVPEIKAKIEDSKAEKNTAESAVGQALTAAAAEFGLGSGSTGAMSSKGFGCSSTVQANPIAVRKPCDAKVDDITHLIHRKRKSDEVVDKEPVCGKKSRQEDGGGDASSSTSGTTTTTNVNGTMEPAVNGDDKQSNGQQEISIKQVEQSTEDSEPVGMET